MDSVRRCSFCFNLFPPTEDFFSKGRAQDGLKKRCKTCEGQKRVGSPSGAARRKNLPPEQKRRARGSGHVAIQQRWKKKVRPVKRTKERLKLADLVRQIKLEKGCVDCGYKGHPVALDFDHLPEKGPKLGSVSRLVSQVMRNRVLEEIEKCEVVCANCHRIRTYNRLRAPKQMV